MRRLTRPGIRTVATGLFVLVATGVLPACGGRPEVAAAGQSAEAPYDTVAVSAEKMPLERFVDGRVESLDRGTLTAQTAGRVVALPVDVDDRVDAGTVLVRLKGTEQRAGLAQAEAGLAEAAARETEAQARYRRIADMQARKVVPKAALDEATAGRDAAVARLAAARAAVAAASEAVAYTEVRAPYPGVVTRRHVQVGESVGPGAPLIGLTAPGKLRVVTDLPQQWAAAVRAGGKATIHVDGRRLAGAGVTVAPEASPDSGAVPVRVELSAADAGGLFPGMIVKVGFAVGEAARLRVPASAVVARSEVTGVYVFDPRGGGRTAFRQVRLGHSAEGKVEVLAGLAAGDRVAPDPAAAIRHLAAATPSRGDAE
jgi:RND family efflux transporter MFP subunit